MGGGSHIDMVYVQVVSKWLVLGYVWFSKKILEI